MLSKELENKVKNLDTVGLLDNRIQELSFQCLQEAEDKNWRNVVDCFRELAYSCSQKGLTINEFLLIRKDLIQTMETFEPLAKTHIEQEEKQHG